jgi:hypothetical protein
MTDGEVMSPIPGEPKKSGRKSNLAGTSKVFIERTILESSRGHPITARSLAVNPNVIIVE